MDFKRLFTFLEELEKNNSKPWMDQNRGRYRALRDEFIRWIDMLNSRLSEEDPDYYDTSGRRSINRINNNLMFHPHKPVYKDHFGAGLDKAPGTGDFYIQIGSRESLLAGGLWRPAGPELKSIREAIDYNGKELLAILEKPSFKKTFGHLYLDERLRSSPKGYTADHPYIELLKNKTFAVVCPLSRKEVLAGGFEDRIIAVYLEMLPFRRYLNHALTV
ncbi:MAG: DUF2461 domain-containing protein [Flavobacteriaceae bacterium]